MKKILLLIVLLALYAPNVLAYTNNTSTTFTQPLTVPAPTTGVHATNRDYVDAGDTTSGQNELILGSLLNNGFFETHEFEVVIDTGVVYAEIWSAANAYGAGTTYNRGNYTIYDNMRYFSLIDSNTGNQPDISPASWEVIALADFNLHGFIEGSNRIYNLDTTTGAGVSGHARIALTAGTDASPTRNWVYATMNGSLDLILATTTSEPTGPVIKLGWTEIASVATTTTQGAVNQQRFTNGLYKEDIGTGQIQTVRDKLRKRVTYNSGVDPSLTIIVNGASLDNVILTTTIGETQQLWPQMFPAFTGTPTFYVMNHPTNPVTQQYTDLNEIDVDATGASLRDNTDRYALRIWGNQSSGTGSTDALYVTLPTGHYATDQQALLDATTYDTTVIDDQFISTFFNICRVVLRYQTAGGGTITNLVGGTDVQDKRSEIIGAVGGSGGATSSQTEFTTDVFRLLDPTDPTKQLDFDVSAISTGTLRTITMLDADFDFANAMTLDGTQTVTGDKTFSGATILGKLTNTIYADAGGDTMTTATFAFSAARTLKILDYDSQIAADALLDDTTGLLAANTVDSDQYVDGSIDGEHIAVIADSEWLPIGWAEDGTTAPAAIAAITGTTRNKGRGFSATVNNDVTFIWQVPKDFSGSTVTIQVTGIVSAATAPANAEIIHFTAAIASWANSELSTIAEGTLQATALTADATYVQYDAITTVASSAITPAGSIAAGETCAIEIIRLAATTDTYTQIFTVTGINVNYSKQLAN